MQQAENEAAKGELTKDRLEAILNETRIRLGESPIERISVKAWLEGWLAAKEATVTSGSFSGSQRGSLCLDHQ
jgi:hypothetical protein